MTHDEIYEGRVARDKRNYPVMTHEELLAKIGKPFEFIAPSKALRAVVVLCVIQDEVTIGDKGLFNSGRNSMRDEIIQAIEKELK